MEIRRHAVIGLLCFLLLQATVPETVVRASATSENEQLAKQAIRFLEHVVELDFDYYTKYTYGVLEPPPDEPEAPTTLLMYFAGPNGDYELRVDVDFVNETLVGYTIQSGHPHFKYNRSATVLEAARRLAHDYMRYMNSTWCEKLVNALDKLDNVEDLLNETITIPPGDVHVKNGTAIIGDVYVYVLYYPSPYYPGPEWWIDLGPLILNVSCGRLGMGFTISSDEDGYFVRAAGFSGAVYKLASDEVNITKREALEIARPIAEAYAEEYGTSIKEMVAKLTISKDPRSSPFLLYMCWYVEFYFEEEIRNPYVPNNIDYVGGYVLIRADTGEVLNAELAGFRGSPRAPTGSSPALQEPANNAFLVAFPIVVAASVILGFLTYRRKKRARRR